MRALHLLLAPVVLAVSVSIGGPAVAHRPDPGHVAQVVVAAPSGAGLAADWSTGGPVAGLLAALLVVVAVRRRAAAGEPVTA